MSKQNKQGNPLSKMKIILLTLALLVVLGGLLAVWLLIVNTRADSTIANIYQNGKVVRSVDLSKIEESYTIEIDGEHGERNVVLVEPGRISMKEASCPDQICVNTGAIDSGILPITCLPNQVVIKIEGNVN